MSRMRVICEKMSTRLPSSLRRPSSLSSSCSLPQFWIKCSPIGLSPRSSTPSKRYGWLHALRSCIRMLDSFVRPPLLPACESTSTSRRSTSLYTSRCISVIPTKRFVLIFGGRSFATSAFSRRSMKGRRIRCSWLTMRSFALSSCGGGAGVSNELARGGGERAPAGAAAAARATHTPHAPR